jgi:selenocysteine lyase/cysteine desulfurase
VDPLEARDLFPLAGRYIHMNHAGVSPMSQPARAAIEQVVEAMMNRPYRDHWAQDEADRVRGLVARLINAPDASIALTRSTAHGLSLLAQGLAWEKGDNVVGATGEYPANAYPWMNLARRGVEFRQAPAPEGRITPESVMDLVDARTKLVAVSHVEFWNGYRVDIDAIGAECRRRGVVFAVDVMQSAGALKLDLERLPVDFCAAGAGKWLMGPPGIGFCFCSGPLLERLQPVIVGVGSVAAPDQYFEYDLTPAQGARRFEESVVSLLDTVAFGAALDVLLKVGPDVIETRVLSLAQKLAAGVAAAGYEIIEPWPRTREESSGIVSFRSAAVPAPSLLRDLTAARVIARTHRDFVRLSPHFYNTEQEVERVLEILAPERVNP